MKKGKQKNEVVASKKDKTKKSLVDEGSKSKKKSQNDNDKSDDTKKPTRGLAIGDNFGWTGKLPATLLHEHCQKQKWGKVIFDMRKSSKGFTGVVNLSWVDPKSKDTIQIQMIPENDLYQPKETTNEARHYAATYALYRINYIKNMKMILPKIFRDYWSDMETKRIELLKLNKEKHDRIYNSNPFTVYLAEKEKQERLEKEQLIKQQNEAKVRKPAINLSTGTMNVKKNPHDSKENYEEIIEERTHFFPKKVWAEAPFIDFPSDIRISIENSVKMHLNWMVKNKDLLKDSTDREKISSNLSRLGFRQSHIEESFKYTSSFMDALEWLLFHIPEDDLPLIFSKSEEESGVSLKISKDISFENLVRKMSESGCDKDVILTTLKECNNDEIKTAVKLTQQLVHFKSFGEYEESQSIWEEEIELIKSIGSNFIEYCEGFNKKVVNLDLNVQNIEKGLIALKLFKSEDYPNELPGMQIIVKKNSVKIANYIKISILRELSSYLINESYIGACFIHVIIEWLEENISKIIDNPGNLIQNISLREEKTNQNLQGKSMNNQLRTKSGQNSDIDDKLIEEIKIQYLEKIQSSEFKNSIKFRSQLPAWKKKEKLVSVINDNRVTLVTGETGSGKSTQIVQFILDDLYTKGNFRSKIICTQPRRISSIGLAERVSEERVDKLGNEVGYIIRGENKTTKRTRISFITTGVLLRMLQSYSSNKKSNMFEDLEYIFIDEVHERSVDSDFLLIILKRLLKKIDNVKVILMSATINIEKFKNFFTTPVNHIHIEGRTFPIEDIYLDTILEDIDYTMTTYNDELIRPKADSNFFKSGNLNYDLISKICLYIDDNLTSNQDQGSILIFLPGISEINSCIRHITEIFNVNNKSCWCLPLHSALSSNEQKRVFKPSSPKSRKIVVSTNVAETSITIPDCVVVIDSGRSKALYYDTKYNTSKLTEDWCSKAEIFQRRGRSGRIRNGKCYHLYTTEIQKNMLDQPIPEIKRTRLENLYLVVKAMGINNVEQFLNSGLDAPDQKMLANAKKLLNEIGAINNGQLSNLGAYLSYLPTDLKSGKLLILGCIFGCLEVSLTLAAVASTGSPFLNNFDQRDNIKKIQAKFSNNQGDLMAISNVYDQYERLRAEGKNTKKFISDNFLSYLVLKDIRSTRDQYVSLLKDLKFIPLNYNKKDEKYQFLNKNMNQYAIVRAILTGAFYPHIARVQTETKFFQSSVGSIEKENDTKSTRFWIRNEEFIEKIMNKVELDTTLPANRAFIHPSSVLLQNLNEGSVDNMKESYLNEEGIVDIAKAREMFDLSPHVSNGNPLFKAPFIIYGTSHQSSKLFLRDITPTSTLATLLFGGEINYDITSSLTTGKKLPGIVLDEWIPVRTWCKNGVLIKRLRVLLDGLIEEKLSNPDNYSRDQEDILKIFERAITMIT